MTKYGDWDIKIDDMQCDKAIEYINEWSNKIADFIMQNNGGDDILKAFTHIEAYAKYAKESLSPTIIE